MAFLRSFHVADDIWRFAWHIARSALRRLTSIRRGASALGTYAVAQAHSISKAGARNISTPLRRRLGKLTNYY